MRIFVPASAIAWPVDSGRQDRRCDGPKRTAAGRRVGLSLVGAALLGGWACSRAEVTQPAATDASAVVSAASAAPDPCRSPVRFATIADVQYGDREPKGTRFYRESVGKLRQAMEVIRRARPDFVISVGDIIDRGFDSFARILPEVQGEGLPARYFVLGNHEWNLPAEQRAQVMPTLDLASGYYSFTIDDWHFIVLDGTEVSGYGLDSGSARRGEAKAMLRELKRRGSLNAEKYNGAVSPEQLLFLLDELEFAAAHGARAIVFCHFPVFPPEAVANLWNDGDVRAVLSRFPGVAVAHISGHDHRGHYGQQAGVHYLTLDGMVETEETSAFALVELCDDRIEIEGYGRQPSRTLLLPEARP